MTDDQLLLASDYLDGLLDAADRARAEADPVVMEEVERQRQVRELLRGVEAPDPVRRDQAIAAALRVADPAAGPIPPPPAPVPLPQRPRRAWWGFAAAAAAVVVVAVGAVGVLGDSSSDDGSFDAAPSASTPTFDQTMAAAPEARDSAGGEPDAEDDAADTAATEHELQLPGASTPGADAGSEAFPPQLATPEDLRDFATAGAAATATGLAPSCHFDGTFVGHADYAGTPVEVFTDATTVTALDAASCAVVVAVDA